MRTSKLRQAVCHKRVQAYHIEVRPEFGLICHVRQLAVPIPSRSLQVYHSSIERCCRRARWGMGRSGQEVRLQCPRNKARRKVHECDRSRVSWLWRARANPAPTGTGASKRGTRSHLKSVGGGARVTRECNQHHPITRRDLRWEGGARGSKKQRRMRRVSIVDSEDVITDLGGELVKDKCEESARGLLRLRDTDKPGADRTVRIVSSSIRDLALRCG